MDKRLGQNIILSVPYVMSAEMLQVCEVDERDELDEQGQR